ncbi:MAG: 16S rRNA (cytosine(1402)-N(4))-methyltransferase RsmH [Planctomycetota bacterium]
MLREEVSNALNLRSGGVYVDLTAGRGGHAVDAARAVGPSGQVVLFDLDAGNLAFASARVRTEAGVEAVVVHGSFASVARELQARGMVAEAVLADLGFSSTQVDDAARGFSFMRDGPLDMRLDPSQGVTAADLVNRSDEREIAEMLQRFGEEPLARRIAAKIVAARREAPISTTAQLADLVRDAYGARARSSRMHPATKTFQALRIAVNDELGALGALLSSVQAAARAVHEGRPSWLARGARIAVIGFHSLEDRMVKQCFAEMARGGLSVEATRGAVVASESEAAVNPRARSAKLRVAMVGVPSSGELPPSRERGMR